MTNLWLVMEFTYLHSLFQQSALFLRPYLMRLFLLSLTRKMLSVVPVVSAEAVVEPAAETPD